MSSQRAYEISSSPLCAVASNSILVGKSCEVLVIGRTVRVDACPFQLSADTTRAGRTLPCSWPTGTPKSASQIWPRRASLTIEAVSDRQLPHRVLVELDGARGAAIGTAGVEIGAAIVAGMLLMRGRPHLRPRLSTVPKVAAAALLACAPLLVGGVPIAAELLASTLIYGVGLLMLRAFPHELRELLPARLKGPT